MSSHKLDSLVGNLRSICLYYLVVRDCVFVLRECHGVLGVPDFVIRCLTFHGNFLIAVFDAGRLLHALQVICGRMRSIMGHLVEKTLSKSLSIAVYAMYIVIM